MQKELDVHLLVTRLAHVPRLPSEGPLREVLRDFGSLRSGSNKNNRLTPQLDRHELRPPEVAWCIPEEHRFKASGTQHAVRLPESDAARRPEHIFTLKPDHNTRFVPVKPSRSVRRAFRVR